MKVLFVNDTYYSRTDHGVYAYGAFPYALWADRYLPYFDHVTVVGREKSFVDDGKQLDRADGEYPCQHNRTQ